MSDRIAFLNRQIFRDEKCKFESLHFGSKRDIFKRNNQSSYSNA